MVDLRDISSTEIAIGVSAFVAVVGYLIFIFAPSWSSYGRGWERIAAGFLSLFILATILGVGVAAGIGVIALYLKIAAG